MLTIEVELSDGREFTQTAERILASVGSQGALVVTVWREGQRREWCWPAGQWDEYTFIERDMG
jgi:hypothetical protein